MTAPEAPPQCIYVGLRGVHTHRADKNDAKYFSEAEVKAMVAAALQRAAEEAYAADSLELATFGNGPTASRILALIDTDHAAALEAVKAQEWNRALEWAARIIEAMWDDAPYGSQSAAVLYDAKHGIRAGKVQP
jgi:hypothetical protein